MDEAEKYQQRLQAIAEKRRLQEEEERLRREVEEEWLKLAQSKRKSLRDQWLMDVPNTTAADGPGPPAPLWPPAQRTEGQEKEDTEEEEGKTQNEEEEEEEEETPVQDGSQTNSTENNTHASCQVDTEDDTDEKESHAEVEETALLPNSSLPIQNGGEDRSVLGMLEVRVEKDLRTGATVITSVAPLPPGDHPGVTEVEMVFDDGRKSVRAVRGSLSAAAQPSAKELGQVLNTLAEVGVPALLEVRGLVPPSVEGQGGREEAEAAKEAEAESEEAELEAEAESEDRDQAADSGSSHKSSQELEPEEDAVDSRGESVGDADSVNEKGEETDEHDNVIDTEEEEDEEEEEEMFRPEEGLDPITLTFLGFSQAATDPGQGNQDDGTLVRVERVFVREDSDEEEEGREGEEYSQDHELACPQTEISHTSTSPVLGTHERQPGAEGLAEMADPGLETHERQPGAEGLAEMADPSLETHLATQTDWPQARQGGGDTEEKRHRSTDTEAIDPARAAASGHDPDRGSPEVPLHLSSCPTLGTRTEGAEMEGEMGRGEGAVEKESLDDVFQDVGLEDPQLSPARDPEWQSSCGEPSRAEGVGSPKHKTCQCCSVM